MRQVKDELCKPGMFTQFLYKGIFNGKEVNYLAVLPMELSEDDTPIAEKSYHIFSSADVVTIFASKMVIKNSKARRGRANEMDDQKVVFRYRKNIGEFEIRTDSKANYRLVKMRLHGHSEFITASKFT